MDVWSWPLSAVGIFGYFLLGVKHKRSGWLVGVLYNVLWIVYAIATAQWGFITVCAFFIAINAIGYYKWEDKDESGNSDLRTTGIGEEYVGETAG